MPRPVVSLRIPGSDYPTAEAVLGIRPADPVDQVMTRGEFWRPQPSPPDDPAYVPEAYLWGFSNKPGARAFSLLLLPFTLINVAYWARPPRLQMRVVSWLADEAIGILCRLLALLLTMTLMAAGAGSAMDLIAWQCLKSTGCPDRWPQPFNLIGQAHLTAGQRLAIGAAVPLLLLTALWYHSHRSWRRYERGVDIRVRSDVNMARFWRGRDWVHRLRPSHAIVAMAVVDGLLAYPTLKETGRNPVGYAILFAVVAAVFVAITGVVTPLPVTGLPVRDPARIPAQRGRNSLFTLAADRTAALVDVMRGYSHGASGPVGRLVRLTSFAMLGVTGAAVAYAAWPRPRTPTPPGSVPGYGGLIAVLSGLQVLLLLGLGGAILLLRWTTRKSGVRMALKGFVAPIIASVACMLATAEAAGTLYFTALTIGQIEESATVRGWEPAPPYPYEWAGLVFAVAMGSAAVGTVMLGILWRRLVRSGARLTDNLYGGLRTADPEVARIIDQAHARGKILRHLPGLAMIVFVPVALLSIVGVVYSSIGEGPSVLLASSVAAQLGTWSIGLLAIFFVYLVVRTGAMSPVRRVISTIWALATFWPRATHPFAAPAHGPRAVADVVSRVTRLTAAGNSVLIAGHSHGALIATIAVSYLPEEVVARTGLLTSASPAVRLIEPFFGAILNRRKSDEIAASLTGPDGVRWSNLYRLTDPLGGPAFDYARGEQPDIREVDLLVPDPPSTEIGPGLDPTPRGHNDYLHDRVFQEEHARLVHMLADRPARHPSQM